jgi:predicted transposase YdaD
MTFLRYYLRFENHETLTKFEQQITVLTGGSNTMGIEELLLDRAKKEGIEEGIEKGEYKKALDVARETKNDGIPFAQIEKFTRLSMEEIEKL